jgi:hypothetical protein
VLRYSPYNVAVKQVIDSGALGEIINIQHIEPVGNQHFAHSYVRGNWHKEADASFSLMAKCCHDIDILSFYLSGLEPVKVHSFGSIGHFKPSKQPEEAQGAKRCLDCPIEKSCVWSAKKIYVEPLAHEMNRDRVRHFALSDLGAQLIVSGQNTLSMPMSWTLRMSPRRCVPGHMAAVSTKLATMWWIIK